jgi:hypothetical protein
MTIQKILFVLFSTDSCKRNHALMYALDLEQKGHTVRIILEGEATRGLSEREGRFAELFGTALERGIVAGACKTASCGCSTSDPERNVTAIAAGLGIPLLDDMGGHASIETYIADGFSVVVF